jgi:hypothetical protein
MGLSIRGLTRGVMGGITAYRRGALQGNEQNREIAAAEAARMRQAKQDELAAMYQQMESNLAERRQKGTEAQNLEENRLRAQQLDIDRQRAKAYETGQSALAAKRVGTRRGGGISTMTTNELLAWQRQLIADNTGGLTPQPRNPEVLRQIDIELQQRGRFLPRVETRPARRGEPQAGPPSPRQAVVSPYGPRP